jgi:hypothetical protein
MSKAPTGDEAIAVTAAIARFVADTASDVAKSEAVSPWRRAALIEGVGAKALAQDRDRGGDKWLS